jgi:hypothetical protein
MVAKEGRWKRKGTKEKDRRMCAYSFLYIYIEKYEDVDLGENNPKCDTKAR